MKMLIFVVVLILVVTAVFWRVRKADAERALARERELHRKEKQRRQAVTPTRPVEWPVMIRPTGKHPSDEDEKTHEPSMSTIEFKPVEEHRDLRQ